MKGGISKMELDNSLIESVKSLVEVKPVEFGNVDRGRLLGLVIPERAVNWDSFQSLCSVPKIPLPKDAPRNVESTDVSIYSLYLDPLFSGSGTTKYSSFSGDDVTSLTGILFRERFFGIAGVEGFSKPKFFGKDYSSKEGCPIYFPIADNWGTSRTVNAHLKIWQHDLVRPIYSYQQENLETVRNAIRELDRKG